MFFQHIYEKGLAQASYLVGCQASGTAIVIDPKRDIDTYLEIAKKERLKITHVTETHIHADFLSGTRELAVATGAQILLSDEGGPDWLYQYDHTALKDGQTFMVGNLKFQVMHTPGHTPEHISFLLTDVPTGDQPVMMFTGDFVFVGDVGRPDLLEKAAGISGTMEIGARQMFHSLKKFKALPDFIQVWPGHGAGSACGKALGAVPSSTVGYQKLFNWALRIDNEKTFVETLLDGQPEPPKYFAMMKKFNKAGAKILKEDHGVKKLTLDELQTALAQGMPLIDTRHKSDFAGGHIPGSISIPDNASFSTWAGWLLEYEKQFLLIAAEHRIGEIRKALIRIGLDSVVGYFSDIEEWAETHELETLEQITACDLYNHIKEKNVHVIDVRSKSEFDSGHLPGALHIHGGHLKDRLKEIPADKKLIIQCQSGDRSNIASSVLLANGFKNVTNLSGGINAWKHEGLPVEK